MQFDFKKIDLVPYKMKINNSLFLHLERVTNSYAILYFTNELNDKISVPNDIRVYDSVYDDKNGILQLKKTSAEIYYLSWTDNHVVKYKEDIILSITNPRVWDITTFFTK